MQGWRVIRVLIGLSHFTELTCESAVSYSQLNIKSSLECGSLSVANQNVLGIKGMIGNVLNISNKRIP